MMVAMFNSRLLAILFLVFINALVFYESWQTEIRAREAGGGEIIGPGLYVGFLGFLLMIFSIIYVASFFRGNQNLPRISVLFGRKSIRPAEAVAIMSAYISLLPYLGYLLATITFMALMYSKISQYNLFKSILYAVLVGFSFVVVFDKFLSIPVPRGFIF